MITTDFKRCLQRYTPKMKKKWKGIPLALYLLRAQGIYLSPSTTKGWPPCCNGGTQGGWRRPLSPSPKDPLHSFQVKLNYPPCLFEDVQCAHTSLAVQINPWPISVHAEDAAFVPAPRQKAYTKHLRPAPGMEWLIIYPNIFPGSM